MLKLGNVPLILNGEFRGIVRLSSFWVALWRVLVPGMGRRHCRMIVRGLNWSLGTQKRPRRGEDGEVLGGVIERGDEKGSSDESR